MAFPLLPFGRLWLLLLIFTVTCPARKLSKRASDPVKNLKTVARQLMLHQFYNEEQTRSSGSSGLKSIRMNGLGSRDYFTPVYNDANFAAIHDHSNYERTVGLGELIVVLNGVEFRTRHLDYKIKMKKLDRKNYGMTQDIPLPEVPPQVLEKRNLREQIAEMKEWFKAWKNRDLRSGRDYRKYFKPVMCYLEGMWTHSDEKSIDESFDSDRHHLDAHSWLEMQEKTRFTSYTGSKDLLENYAFLPTTIVETNEDGSVKLAQWNFKILCHPLSTKEYLETDRLRLIDDFGARMANKLDLETYSMTRSARFKVSAVNRPYINDGVFRWNFMDRLFEQIPGMDNYPGKITDDAFDNVAYPFSKSEKTPLNVAYFHRWYRSLKAGAMGRMTRHRGFGDENVFMAMNTQKKVAGLTAKLCSDPDDESTCKSWNQKMSFAIPLEIVYLTPLTRWNPFKLIHRGKLRSAQGRSVFLGPNGQKRDGGETADKAYNGTNSEVFYRIPADFFAGEVGTDLADTVKSSVHVLDRGGRPKKVSASGHRVLMNISGVGVIRQRYPIMPLHEEGSAVWKQVQALADIVLEPTKFKHMLRENTSKKRRKREVSKKIEKRSCIQPPTIFVTSPSHYAFLSHVHEIEVSAADMERLKRGAIISARTSNVMGFQHPVTISSEVEKDANGTPLRVYNLHSCDYGLYQCGDRHAKRLQIKP